MLHLERMDDAEAGGERRRAELRHSICQASDDVWSPVRCHYGLHRKDIEIRNQPRVCSLDATNLFKETSAIESAFPHAFNSLTSTPLTPAPAATLPLIRSYIPNTPQADFRPSSTSSP
jgi:hypothetical protein